MNCQKCGFNGAFAGKCPSCGYDEDNNGIRISKLSLRSAKCPNCHAGLSLSELTDVIKCSFCGSDFVVNDMPVRNLASKNLNAGTSSYNYSKLTRSFLALLLISLVTGCYYYFKNLQPVAFVDKPSGDTVQIKNAPSVVKTDNSSLNPPQHYEYVTQWKVVWNPCGVAADSSGGVFSTDQHENYVEKHDPNGKLLFKFGSFGKGNGQFHYPHAIAIDTAGNIYVSDLFNHRIQKFDPGGRYILQWGGNGKGNGQFNRPYGVAVDPSGSVFVSDTYNYRVQKFDLNGNYKLQWGSYGQGNGQFNWNGGIAVDSSGSVYVTDQNNNRVQKFDPNGNFLLQWGGKGPCDGQFNCPVAITADSNDFIYVTEQFDGRIQKFDTKGNFITKWGSQGKGSGSFEWPLGITVDRTGNVYIADSNNSRIQKFSLTAAVSGASR